MANVFNDMLDQPGDEAGEGDDAVRGLLDSLMGAGAAGGQGGLGDLVGGLMGGGGDAAGMGDLLGSLMGGGAGSGAPAGDMGDMAGMLGGLLGGSGSPGGAAGGLGGLLGGLLGGGMSGGDQMSFGGGGAGGPALPFIGPLAEKLGISPQMANMLAMAAIGLLTSSMAKNRDQGRGGGVDLAGLSDPEYLRRSGVVSRLSTQAGISEDDAIIGLQQALGMMAGQPAAKPATGAKKSTAKKPAAKKSTSTKSTAKKPETKKSTAASGTTTKKKSTSKKTASSKPAENQAGSDFMDMLNDITK